MFFMTRKEVYLFIKAGVDALTVQHGFGRGRISEFSSKRDHDYPVVWFETVPESEEVGTELSQNSLPIDGRTIRLHVGKLDKEDSLPDEYEDIIDECDEIAQQLAFKYNSVVSGNNLLTLTGLSRSPFIKKYADSVTGVLLQFTLNGPDTTPQEC